MYLFLRIFCWILRILRNSADVRVVGLHVTKYCLDITVSLINTEEFISFSTEIEYGARCTYEGGWKPERTFCRLPTTYLWSVQAGGRALRRGWLLVLTFFFYPDTYQIIRRNYFEPWQIDITKTPTLVWKFWDTYWSSENPRTGRDPVQTIYEGCVVLEWGSRLSNAS